MTRALTRLVPVLSMALVLALFAGRGEDVGTTKPPSPHLSKRVADAPVDVRAVGQNQA